MRETIHTRLYGRFYGSACKAQLTQRFSASVYRKVNREYSRIIRNAKDIGRSRLLSAYCMGAYFIALNRTTGLPAEACYQLFRDSLYANGLFRRFFGTADSYLDRRKFPGRQKWAEQSHQRKYENDWVVDVLDRTDTYELGYDYWECGICKLCRDEGCPELAGYLCRLDFVLADIMGMKLERTMTLAQGDPKCDFRYSRLSGKQVNRVDP